MRKLIAKHLFADQDIEQFIGLQLRYGVIISSLIVLIGGLIYMHQSGSLALPAYGHFIGTKTGFTSIKEITTGLSGFEAKGIIQLGVVVLIATPILRIAFSLFGFILEKDRMYTIITLVVLCIMLFSIFGGLKV